MRWQERKLPEEIILQYPLLNSVFPGCLWWTFTFCLGMFYLLRLLFYCIAFRFLSNPSLLCLCNTLYQCFLVKLNSLVLHLYFLNVFIVTTHLPCYIFIYYISIKYQGGTISFCLNNIFLCYNFLVLFEICLPY